MAIFFEADTKVLYCGIWGFSSKFKKNWNGLNRFKFELLGVEMDSRGGDGCGIAYDNMVHKSHKARKFDEFWRQGHVPTTLEYPCILGHDRRASVGAQSFENTQPIYFADSISILAHNGTLTNHKEMYEKHKIEAHFENTDITTMSDSQVFALLLERLGWSVLAEYNGSAAFLYMDARYPGKMFAFHGKSPTRKNVTESEERPLYYVKDSGNIWFCSTKAALEKIVSDRTKIEELPFNKVFEIEGDELREIYTVDRSNCYQFENVTTCRTEYGAFKGNDPNGYWDADSRAWVYPKKKEKESEQLKMDLQKGVKGLATDRYVGKSAGYIYWEAGLYRVHGYIGQEDKVANGQLIISSTGRILSKDGDGKFPQHGVVFYFYRGNLCTGRDAYLQCMRNEYEYSALGIFTPEEEAEFMLAVNGTNFVYPFTTPACPNVLTSNTKTTELFKKQIGTCVPCCYAKFSGMLSPAFRGEEIFFRDGLMTSMTSIGWSGFPGIIKHKDPHPEEFSLDMAALKAEFEEPGSSIPTETPSKEEERFECPSCGGIGYKNTFICKECSGEGTVSREYIETEIKMLEINSEILGVRSEEMKVLNSVYDMVESGIEILEEEEFKRASTEGLNKLISLKKIIEGK